MPTPLLSFESLSGRHDRSKFKCENTAIDLWFRYHSLRWEEIGYSRTYVLLENDTTELSCVVGLFALNAESQYLTGHPDAPPFEGELVPPVVQIAFLARDIGSRGKGYGEILLLEALHRCREASKIIGAVGVYLRATSEGRRLYQDYGFQNFGDQYRMYKSMREIREQLDDLAR